MTPTPAPPQLGAPDGRLPRRSDPVSAAGGDPPANARPERRPGGSADRPSAGQRPRRRPPSRELDAGRPRRGRRARALSSRGLPRAFSAGVDVAEHVPEPAAIERMLAAMRERPERARSRRPRSRSRRSRGACLGGGAEIVAACDLVARADDARVGFPEIRLACFPPGAAALLPGADRRGARRGLDPHGRDASRAARRRTRGSPRASCRPRRGSARRPIGWRTHPRRARPPGAAAARDLLRASRREALARRPAATRRRRIAGSRATRTWPGPCASSARPAPLIASRAMPIVYLNGRFVPENEAAHLAARPRLPLRRRDLRGRALRPRPPLPPGRAPRPDARGPRRDPRSPATPDFFAAVGASGCSRRTVSPTRTRSSTRRSRAARLRATTPSRRRARAPTVFAFARETDPPPPPEGGKAILLTDERWGRCDIKSVDAAARTSSPRRRRSEARRDRRDPRSRRLRARGDQGQSLHGRRGACCAPPRTVRASCPGVTRGAAIEAARTHRPHRRGAGVHGRGDVRGAGGLLRLDDAVDATRSSRSKAARSATGSRARSPG